MESTSRNRRLTLALYVVAALLLANLGVSLLKRDAPSFLPAAMAQENRQAPIAGGAGLFIMPAQLSSTTWGCYMMDVDRGTLCVYQYLPGGRQLQLVAARYVTHDRNLKNFNTLPSPQEVADLVEKEAQALRAGPP